METPREGHRAYVHELHWSANRQSLPLLWRLDRRALWRWGLPRRLEWRWVAGRRCYRGGLLHRCGDWAADRRAGWRCRRERGRLFGDVALAGAGRVRQGLARAHRHAAADLLVRSAGAAKEDIEA